MPNLSQTTELVTPPPGAFPGDPASVDSLLSQHFQAHSFITHGAGLGWRKLSTSWIASGVVHVSLAAALCLTAGAVERASLAGRRTVISVASQAVPAQPPVKMPNLVPLPRRPEEPDEPTPEQTELQRSERRPMKLAAAAPAVVAVEVRHTEPLPVKRIRMAESQPSSKPTANTAKMARRQAARPPSPTPSVAIPQTAGIDDRAARALSMPRYYPPEAIRQRLEGRVVLRVAIGADGRVREVTIVESSGHSLLDSAARDAAFRWRYAPATRGGEPVDSVVRQPVRFRL